MSDAAPEALTRADPIGRRAPEVIRILGETYPDATIALHFTNPLELLVATILSAQCTDAKVNEVTETLFKKCRTAEDYLAVPEDELEADIKPTGFFNQKALSIREPARRIVEVYDGPVPDTMEELPTLRGRRAQDRQHRARATRYGIVEPASRSTRTSNGWPTGSGSRRKTRSGQDRTGPYAARAAGPLVRRSATS